MKLKINKDTFIALSVLGLGITTFLSISIFDFGFTINSLVAIIVFLIIFLLTLRHVRNAEPVSILFFISFIFVLINNHDVSNRILIYALSYGVLVCLIFYWCDPKYIKRKDSNISAWILPFQAFLIFWGIMSAIFTILFSIDGNLYSNYILPLTESTTYYSSLVYCFNNGYQPCFALHYSTNGIYLAIFTGICFSNFLFCKKRYRVFNLIVLILSAVALLLTAKRAHIVFSMVAMLVVYYSRNIDNKRSRFIKTCLLIIAAIISFLFLSNYVPAIDGFIERFTEDGETGSLFSSRFVLYAYAFSLFLSNPVFGIGWANYKYLAEIYLGQYNEVHNVYLQILTETGVVGTVLFLLLFFVFVVNSFRNLKKSIEHSDEYSIQEKRITSTNLFLIIFFLLYCISGNPLYDMVVWYPVTLYQIAAYSIFLYK